jgi:hypothetical protein
MLCVASPSMLSSQASPRLSPSRLSVWVFCRTDRDLEETIAANCDTGTLRGRRTSWGGRARVRGALYVGALVATRHNLAIKDLCERLLKVGKPKKVALAACIRKRSVILNAVMRDRTLWDPLMP